MPLIKEDGTGLPNANTYANVAANKTALLQLFSSGTTDADIVARWLVEPNQQQRQEDAKKTLITNSGKQE